ncbi:hypothetical protein BLGI_1749 [Brevibacillus laterosporus GI-9]|uniref:anti-sigma factor family protein n=1 Tax=Brevibacillus laterosporus TaxID=1465 RepID=UPI0002403906|nr:zf-HC2 domain-containing protein [Brevibacillus laterosporus]CCF13830.1 hypothetical protein BLGI_1749 [Brevibacillus laterosporus GI-9]
MQHPDEFTFMMYADGELIQEEHQQVASHLQSCSECQKLYATFLEEQAELVKAIHLTTPKLPPIHLEKNVCDQINQIATFNQNRHHLFVHRLRFVFGASLGFFLVMLLAGINWLNDWNSAINSLFQWQSIWSSMFWLKEKATMILLMFKNFYLIGFISSILFVLAILLYSIRLSSKMNANNWRTR